MRKILLFLMAVSLIVGCKKAPPLTPEAEKLLSELEAAGDLIVAAKVGEVPMNLADPAWSKTKEATISLVSQTSIIPRSTTYRKTDLVVRVLYSKKEIGLRIEWADATRDERDAAPELFRDAVAIGFPVNYGQGAPLPYVGMGNKSRPMNIWQWRASWQTDMDRGFQGVDTQYPASARDHEKVVHLSGEETQNPMSNHQRIRSVENLLAEGFGSLTSMEDESLIGKGEWKNGRWSVVIKRSLDSGGKAGTVVDTAKALLPITFAVWDGAGSERNGIKALTRWRFLRFEGEHPTAVILKSYTWKPSSSAERGRQLAKDAGCVACHNLPDSPAVNDVGPDLSHAGAIHRAEYLFESIKTPNAVIVPAPGYYDPKTGSSTMPSYTETFQEQDFHDLTEYLRTLQ